MSRLFCLVCLVFLFSCKEKQPKDIIPQNQMKMVLWDMMRVDELANYNMKKDTLFGDLAKPYYKEVFRVHHITQKEFKRNLDYYLDHPDMFKSVLDSLQTMVDRPQPIDSSWKRKTPQADIPAPSKNLDSLNKPARIKQ
jgi:hypothetical protein